MKNKKSRIEYMVKMQGGRQEGESSGQQLEANTDTAGGQARERGWVGTRTNTSLTPRGKPHEEHVARPRQRQFRKNAIPV